MSIDQRLRSGLRNADQDPVDPNRLVDGWSDVVLRAEKQRSRDRARWGVATAAAAVLVVAAAVTWWPRAASEPEPLPPAPSPTSNPSSGPTATPSTDPEPSPLEGTWRAGPASAQVVVAHLESVGLGQWTDTALDGTSSDATIAYQLKLQDGRLTMARAVDAAAPVIEDVEDYEITGDRVELSPQTGGCATVFDWRVQGDRLHLHLVSDSCPDYRGSPDAASMEALYGAFDFTR